MANLHPSSALAVAADDCKDTSTTAKIRASNTGTSPIPTAAEMAHQRQVQKTRIKTLTEQQEKHRAVLQKAQADDERLKSQTAALQAFNYHNSKFLHVHIKNNKEKR